MKLRQAEKILGQHRRLEYMGKPLAYKEKTIAVARQRCRKQLRWF